MVKAKKAKRKAKRKAKPKAEFWVDQIVQHEKSGLYAFVEGKYVENGHYLYDLDYLNILLQSDDGVPASEICALSTRQLGKEAYAKSRR